MPDSTLRDNLPSGMSLHHTLQGHNDVITQIAWSPDGSMLASASLDGTLRLWDHKTSVLRQVIDGRSGGVCSVAWSPDAKLLAAGFGKGVIQVWTTETADLYRTIAVISDQPQQSLLFGDELEDFSKAVCSVEWLPDGQTIAAGTTNNSLTFWDVETGEQRQVQGVRVRTASGIEDASFISRSAIIHGRLQDEAIFTGAVSITYGETGTQDRKRAIGGYGRAVYSAFTTFGRQLLGATSPSRMLRLPLLRELIIRVPVSSLERSPDGSMLASASLLASIRLYDLPTIEERRRLRDRVGSVLGMAWSPDGKVLASAVLEGTVQLWDSGTGAQTQVLEGHTDAVVSVAFSYDGRLLASKALDNTVRIWRCDTWEPVAVLYEQVSGKWFSGLAFHPDAPVLATLGEQDTVIRIWNLEPATLLSAASVVPSLHYTNAKVVLLGDSSVGKSGLALVLSGDAFRPTESTHGRHIWTFDRGTVFLQGGQIQIYETLLWDLAGQPGYRLIHQLHLSEVAVALVIFDARSETDPFSGVRHWDRALRAAQRVQGGQSPPLAKLLVSACADRGGAGVSLPRIKALVQDLGFTHYFETSAKEGWGIEPLAQAVREAIDWSKLPRVSSSRLFQQIKDFLLAEKKAGRLLSTADDLYRAFLGATKGLTETPELREQFEVCIGRVEARGLIRRLSFGVLILLQPELLDAYASALVNTAKDEPDGLGCMAEEDARVGRFRMSDDEKVKNRAQERLLLIATVEELLWHEIALREQADDGSYLVFPSQLTREWPDAPDPEGKGVIFEFEGPVQNVYATLAVRLSRSGLFTKKAMWKNAASYAAIVGGTCGIYLREIAEGHAEMIVFYDKAAITETRFQFEEYVYVHLQRRALRESVYRRYVLACPNCDETFPDRQVQRRRERGLDWMNCGVCDTRVSLTGHAADQSGSHESRVPEMDLAADAGRESATVASMLQGKIETRDFDVFLCHKNEDKPAVKGLGTQLKDLGILP